MDLAARYEKYGEALNSHHLLKAIALVIMTIDHIGLFIFPDQLWWRAIGRVTFPVWFFLIGHAPHYQLRGKVALWALALVLINPLLGRAFFPLNALVTIMACQLVLLAEERWHFLKKQPAMTALACALFVSISYPLMEYGTLGVLYALMGYAVREDMMRKRSGIIIAVVAFLLFVLMQIELLQFDVLQSAFVILVTAYTTWYLAHFKFKPVRWRLAFLQPAAVFLSRVSLEYYVLHRIALQALGVGLGVLKAGFRWF